MPKEAIGTIKMPYYSGTIILILSCTSTKKATIMNEHITKDDLRQFGMLLINEMRAVMAANSVQEDRAEAEWIKTRAVRKLLDISAGTLQNIRVTEKIRCKKVLGSYYYNKADLLKLFSE